MEFYASSNLVGKQIGQWQVLKKIENIDITSQYSVFYLVKNDELEAIMKVMDYEKCHSKSASDGLKVVERLSMVSTAFLYETNAAKSCAFKHMNNVIRYIDSGEIELEGYQISTVTFIVYEQSEGKVGAFLKFSSKVDFKTKIEILKDKIWSLHQVAKGVKQLHSNLIAHHNITPLSIEVFDKNCKFKLGDLHSSKCRKEEFQSPEGTRFFNGDLTYAPPEAFFAYKISDEMAAYYQIDTYMLGNMIVYYLTSFNLTALLNRKLPYSLKEWASRGANYVSVLPEIINAFDTTLKDIRSSICIEELQEPILNIIECMCNPDPDRRGYPGGFKTTRANADLQRIITKLDMLHKIAEFYLYKEIKS